MADDNATKVLSKRFKVAPPATLMAVTPLEVKPAERLPWATVTVPPPKSMELTAVTRPRPVLVSVFAAAALTAPVRANVANRFGTDKVPPFTPTASGSLEVVFTADAKVPTPV